MKQQQDISSSVENAHDREKSVADAVVVVETNSILPSQEEETGSSTLLSPEEDARLLRKIDVCLLPILAVSYMFQFLDKSVLSTAAILGIRSDLRLSGSSYSWANSAYYFGYMLALYPAAALMVRLPTGKTIAASIFLWGSILSLTPLCFNAAGLLANRFFLGAAESAIAPGIGVIISMWYKRPEQPLRHAAWFAGNSVAGMVGGLMGYGIGHITSIAPWKAVFAIFGAITVTWGVGMIWLIPDVPSRAFFLSDQDGQKAILRVQENLTGIKNNQIKWWQVREAFTDPKTWILVLIQLCACIPNGGIASFSPIVIRGIGFSTLATLLLGSLSDVFQLVYVLIATAGCTFLPNTRTIWLAWGFLLSLVGAAMIHTLAQDPDTSSASASASDDHHWARFFGVCLLLGSACSFPIGISLVTSNTGGFTKKSTMSAVFFVAYCAGNVVGPQLFFDREAPNYGSGFLAMMVCYAAGIVLCFVLRLYLVRENRRRDRMAEAEQHHRRRPQVDAQAINMADLTDKSIVEFRYVY